MMRQLGHTDPAFTLRAYAHSMSRDAGERERLGALTDGDHGRVDGVAIGSEKNRRDAAAAPNSWSALEPPTSWAASKRSSV